MQIIKGYAQIAQKKIIHRDIKPANIFINDSDELVIGDFGFAIDLAECGRPLSENVGSPLYMPPETLRYNIYSLKSDIWALGVIFVQLLTGKTPWKAKTEKQLIYELSTFLIDDIIPKGISEQSSRFLRRVLDRNVNQRLDLAELINFSFSNSHTSS